MNLKRWFAWLCLALMLVAEIFLFRANHGKEVALTGLREAQQENRQLADELAELKNSNAGLQAAEISRLRKQNEILTNKLAGLQTAADRLQQESGQNAQHLTTARTALQLQQEHLAQLQTENQQIAAAQAETLQRNACINNLRQIDAAKLQWALEKNKRRRPCRPRKICCRISEMEFSPFVRRAEFIPSTPLTKFRYVRFPATHCHRSKISFLAFAVRQLFYRTYL